MKETNYKNIPAKTCKRRKQKKGQKKIHRTCTFRSKCRATLPRDLQNHKRRERFPRIKDNLNRVEANSALQVQLLPVTGKRKNSLYACDKRDDNFGHQCAAKKYWREIKKGKTVQRGWIKRLSRTKTCRE